MSTQNCVYKLGCVDCDAVCTGELSREILIRTKENLRCTEKPPNNPVELGRLQIKSTLAVLAIFNKHQVDIKTHQNNTEKAFLAAKKALHILLNTSVPDGREGFTIHLTIYPSYHV
ncbi:unnamed protein product [Schistosoma mattheei]|uniref:Uncharacterized protein n=1 Tax=Schistosoma mattheei TaxID=31246 RepID=A0A183PCG1_9TREM|nr:unnamed protein product [Schistosoma mattheei]